MTGNLKDVPLQLFQDKGCIIPQSEACVLLLPKAELVEKFLGSGYLLV